ncbi:tyrosine/serine/threonine protein phosphatase pps1 [Paramarasmius palmivorus]|uniref:Tyrosine/serine/threonine protein phosphatase pps1 n=1 Tax=Paramarasmius palmivorus TaxID=297713 RepID=A0AAW0BWJ4_9AGAR
MHGLDYDNSFLESLPTPDDRSPDIHSLSSKQFDDLHNSHLLSHAPDSVLFPFLHGIEGDNEAQNLFFASQGEKTLNGTPRSQPGRRSHAVRLPKYRGLMWVVCEEDLENPEKDLRVLVHRPSNLGVDSDDLSESYFTDEDELEDEDDDDDTSSESFSEHGHAFGKDPFVAGTSTGTEHDMYHNIGITRGGVMGMDVDMDMDINDRVDIAVNGASDDVDILWTHVHTNMALLRSLESAQTISICTPPIRTTDLPAHQQQSSTDTPNTTLSSSYGAESFGEETGNTSSSSMSSPTTALSEYEFNSTSPVRTNGTDEPTPLPPLVPTRGEGRVRSPRQRAPRSTPRSPPPILTSSFRACDLLRRIEPENNQPTGSTDPDDDGEWEFVPLYVPDGISLRNFGIQVPILATISDIVIYSPVAGGAAKSPNALRLAKRFQQAIERKRKQREAEGCCPAADPSTGTGGTDPWELPQYNVFVLDATPEDIKRDLTHLVIRLCPDGEVPRSLSEIILIEQPQARQTDDMDIDIEDVPISVSKHSASPHPRPVNTVDFAQRERDEMRDLTKASEIISVFPKDNPLSKLHPVDLLPGGDFFERAVCDTYNATAPAASDSESDVEDSDLSTTKSYWNPAVGQVFLGNVNDVPMPIEIGYDGVPVRGEDVKQGTLDVRGWERALAAGVNILGDEDGATTDDSDGMRDVVEGIRGSMPGLSSKARQKAKAQQRPYFPQGNSPFEGLGYDICIECHELAPFPNPSHFKAVEDKVNMLEEKWREFVLRQRGSDDKGAKIPPRPPPHQNSIIHLPFPSSPAGSNQAITQILPALRFLQRCLVPEPPEEIEDEPEQIDQQGANGQAASAETSKAASSRRWSSVSAFIPSFPSFPLQVHSPSPSAYATPAPPRTPPPGSTAATHSARSRSFTSPAPVPSPRCSAPVPLLPKQRPWSRPLKILLYSSDGYTESSVPALCLLMAVKGLNLPRAYLELQVEKRRSFFVYQPDLGFLKRIESVVRDERRMEKDRIDMEKREKERRERELKQRDNNRPNGGGIFSSFGGFGTHVNPYAAGWGTGTMNGKQRPAAKSVSFAQSPISIPSCAPPPQQTLPESIATPTPEENHPTHHPASVPRSSSTVTLPVSSSAPTSSALSGFGGSLGAASGATVPNVNGTRNRRPRANTSPWLPSLFGGDHQCWFNDARFDGSFPSRVLPFLYLGNLNHASNVYMLQALGITHVVSVGECALVPPQHLAMGPSAYVGRFGHGDASTHYLQNKHQGSLWIEERAGRIKVLDIQGVCDDGIDTLEPQLEPICDWIDQAREEGGQVLVHCRVGVSRSATVTIAYVMKHLNLSLVDAYLIVRSRRLSVLIQPNMRLLYNLLGWEIKLAKQKAGEDEQRLKYELSTALSWPYLAKEVHALNEKYLH